MSVTVIIPLAIGVAVTILASIAAYKMERLYEAARALRLAEEGRRGRIDSWFDMAGNDTRDSVYAIRDWASSQEGIAEGRRSAFRILPISDVHDYLIRDEYPLELREAIRDLIRIAEETNAEFGRCHQCGSISNVPFDEKVERFELIREEAQRILDVRFDEEYRQISRDQWFNKVD